MANDPRTFMVVPCVGTGTGYASGAKKQMVRRTEETSNDIFNSIGKIGDLEFLNDIGFGRVAEGLRILRSTSNSIRLGEPQNGAVRSAVAGNTDGGLYVLENVGVTPADMASVQRFQPGAVNQAYAQARQIWDKVRQGNFEMSDIPEYFQDIQNLFQLAGGIVTDSGATARSRVLCEASPYATDLIAYAPKFKFLFVVEFVFDKEYEKWNSSGPEGDFAKNTAFVVQQTARPEVRFEHETVNMYNYRTHVPVRATYEPMRMTFFDDNQDNALRMYTAILRAMSPISNNDNIFNQTQEQIEDDSMAFDKATKNTYSTANQSVEARQYNASIGPLAGTHTFSIFREIKIYHIANYGRVVDVYRFLRPKITSIKLTDLDMTDSQPPNFELEFSYDALHVEPYVKNIMVNYETGITKLTEGGLYPIRPVFEDANGGIGGPYGENMPPITVKPLIDLSFISDFVKRATGIVGGLIRSITSVVGDFLTGLVSNGQTFLSNAFTGLRDSVFAPVSNAVTGLFGANGSVRAGANYVLGGASDTLSSFSNSFSNNLYTGSRFTNSDLAGSMSGDIFDPPLTQQQQMWRDQDDFAT